MKPIKADARPFWGRAAREKICSDLAHDLSVAVPPVALTVRANAPSGQERFVCVSLVVFPRQWSWGQLRGVILDPSASRLVHDVVMAGLPRQAAAAFAFDTWVEQHDHDDHPHNMAFGYELGASRSSLDAGNLVFFDYAYSLGIGETWCGDEGKTVKPAPFPPLMLQHMDRAALSEAVDKIEGFDEGSVHEVVGRIPDAWMPPDERELLTERLIERRRLVRTALQPHL